MRGSADASAGTVGKELVDVLFLVGKCRVAMGFGTPD